VAEIAFVTDLQGKQAEAFPQIAAAIRRIGIQRVLYGSDGALVGHDTPAQGWERFTKEVPLTDAEFRAIAGNVAPYLRGK
jgi:predicted TIM-barrel fold metal-dependent hydrolase